MSRSRGKFQLRKGLTLRLIPNIIVLTIDWVERKEVSPQKKQSPLCKRYQYLADRATTLSTDP